MNISPTLNTFFHLPIHTTEDHRSYSSMTYFWNSWDLIDLKPFLFFGMSSCDYNWAMDLSNNSRIIAYHHHMGDDTEVVRSDILTVYLADQRECLEIDP